MPFQLRIQTIEKHIHPLAAQLRTPLMSQDYRRPSEPIPAHRRAMILERLRILGSVSINDLADYLQVSASTVRRDLDELMQEGTLERTHGGAISPRRLLSTFEPANAGATATSQKAAIGQEAARRVTPGSSVILDAGSTVDAAARALLSLDIPLTIVTNSLSAAEICGKSSTLRVIVVGGTLRTRSATLWGEPGQGFLSTLQADLCLLGAHAITDDIVTESSIEGADVKRSLMHAARRTVLLADSSKFQPRSFCKVCDIHELAEVITDDGLSKSLQQTLQRSVLKLTLVSSVGA
jgi:DeoR/GlpR family transcriptional regulator of sugar metabolism